MKVMISFLLHLFNDYVFDRDLVNQDFDNVNNGHSDSISNAYAYDKGLLNQDGEDTIPSTSYSDDSSLDLVFLLMFLKMTMLLTQFHFIF